jgi:molecular chaperone HtpG
VLKNLLEETMSREGSLKIHSQNILPIIKKWLYSDKDIFIRELISNSCDALSKLAHLAKENNVPGIKAQEFRIDLKIDAEKQQLIFSDNGLGMDAEEVEKYIAQIAFSGAEEFVQKYQSKDETEQVIGHFGLGFYSSYMVAQKVEIQTLSYKEGAQPVWWECDGSTTYHIDSGSRSERGTDVILHLNPEETDYLNESKIREILTRYCSFLPYAIYLNDQRINEEAPLWMKAPSDCTDKEYLDFYRRLFPFEPEPLFWIHLNVDYPFHLKGILYFPRISHEKDLKKESIQLYCNRVFVSDNCRDLLPDYLMVLRGAIDSPDIPLNVSRSYLQMDQTVRQLGKHISKKISDKLATLHRSDLEKFQSYWPDIELIIKYGALQDEKFYERVKDFFIWKNDKQEWTTLKEYQERSSSDVIYYAPSSQSHETFIRMFQDKGIEVLFVNTSPIDSALLQFLESKMTIKFQRIDAQVGEDLIDVSKESKVLDADGKTEAGRVADFFRNKLGDTHMEVEAKSLASASLPGVLLIKEEERRLRDTLMYHQKEMALSGHPLIKPTLVLNTNSKLIQAIFEFGKTDPDLAKELVHEVYDLVRLSQREMEPEALSMFIQRSTEILERLASRVTENKKPQ